MATMSKSPSSNLNISGILTDRQGYTVTANHIRFAHRKSETGKMQQVTFYEKPLDASSFKQGETPKNGTTLSYELTVNPVKMLRTIYIDFNEVESVEVPMPDTLWTYNPDKKPYQIDYLEVIIKEKGSSRTRNVLVELGRSDSPRPLKLFFSELKEQAQQVAQTTNEFCQGIKKEDLDESGIPLQALKKVVITGYCHEVPTTTK
jgi:hypothetical protein